MWYLGWIICLLVLTQLALSVVRSLLAWRTELQVQKLHIEQAQREIQRFRLSAPPAQNSVVAWEGFRKFRVDKKVAECPGCHSFYLAPHDGKPIPSFLPGQYLTLQIRPPGTTRPLNRCYSLSDAPHSEYFRCTIKKVIRPAESSPNHSNSVSGYFNDVIREGDIVDVKAPRGHFCLDPTETSPLVLIAGGIGITPLFAMLQTIIQLGTDRQVTFILGVRNSREHPFPSQLQAAARRSHIKLHVCYSDPLDQDRLGADFESHGRVSMTLIQKLLPSNRFQFYVCGPAGMMQQISEGLRQWGVPSDSIHTEAFGPSSLSVQSFVQNPQIPASPRPKAKVRFDRSGKSADWTSEFGSLLDLAERVGVAIDSGCRAGSCGTCVTAIKSGTVRHARDADGITEKGVCLPCIATPEEDLVLDA